MKLKHIAAAVAFTALASSSYAAGFTGLGMDAELQFKSTGGDSVMTTVGNGITATKSGSLSGEHETVGALGLNFGFSMAPRWVLQVGAKADLMDTSVHGRLEESRVGTSSTTLFERLEESSHYSVFLQPGYLVHAGTLVYAKLSYHQMKLDGNVGARVTDIGGVGGASFSAGSTFKGFGIGFGVQTLLTKNVYAFAEMNHVRYGSEVLALVQSNVGASTWTAEPRTTSGSIGIGWRF